MSDDHFIPNKTALFHIRFLGQVYFLQFRILWGHQLWVNLIFITIQFYEQLAHLSEFIMWKWVVTIAFVNSTVIVCVYLCWIKDWFLFFSMTRLHEWKANTNNIFKWMPYSFRKMYYSDYLWILFFWPAMQVLTCTAFTLSLLIVTPLSQSANDINGKPILSRLC